MQDETGWAFIDDIRLDNGIALAISLLKDSGILGGRQEVSAENQKPGGGNNG
jgi:hypothetical protein